MIVRGRGWLGACCLTNSLTKADIVRCWLMAASIQICFSKSKKLCSSEGRSSRAARYQYECSSRIRPWQCELSEDQERTSRCTESSVNTIQHDGCHWWIRSCLCTSDTALWTWASNLEDIASGAYERNGNRPRPPKTSHLPWSCPSRYHEVHE